MTLSRIITTSITGLLTSILILSGITTNALIQDQLNEKQLDKFTLGIENYTNRANNAILNSNNLLTQSNAKFDECTIKLDKANLESENFFRANADGEGMTIEALRRKLAGQSYKIAELNRLEKAIETGINICYQGVKIQDRFDDSICVVSKNLSNIEGLIMDIENMPNNKQPRANAQKKLKDLYSKTSDLYNKLQRNFATKKSNFENLKRKYPKYLKLITLYSVKFCSRSPEFLKKIIREGKIKPTSRVSKVRNNSSIVARNLKTNSRVVS